MYDLALPVVRIAGADLPLLERVDNVRRELRDAKVTINSPGRSRRVLEVRFAFDVPLSRRINDAQVLSASGPFCTSMGLSPAGN